jgi:FkbM family methyltransferase
MMLKSVRNLIADSAANAVYQVPLLEQALIHCGRVINPIPLVRTIYRRSTETLTRRLGAVERLHRRLQIDDIEFIFDISDFTVSPWFFNCRLFEPLTTKFVLDYLRPGMTCIDIGANRGYFSILAALRVTASGHVYSFEPNPTVMADLRTHVALNGVEETVECSELAIADSAGKELELFVSTCPTNSGLSSITPSEELLAQGILTPALTIRVRTETLDEWAKAARVHKQIDLIKIDVEGAEDLVLRGMNRLLKDAPPHRIIVETTLNSSAHCRLSQFGYHSKLLDQGGDKFNILFTHPMVTQA